MTDQHQPSHESFMRDVATHEMTVFRDDGLYRHIRFRRPNTMRTHFDLITYPGYLCYSGDMGTYVFSRLDDMFEFFRTDRDINPGYWSEKLQAVDNHGLGRYTHRFIWCCRALKWGIAKYDAAKEQAAPSEEAFHG